MNTRFLLSPRLAAGLGVLALLLATCAGAETRRFGSNPVAADVGPWRAIAAGHVQVCFHPGEDSLAWRTLDLAVRTDGEFTARLGRGLPGRVTVILAAPSAIVPVPAPLDVGVGVGGARAALRQRIVIPFDGSYEDLRRTLVHRLTHVVLRDLPGGRAGVHVRRGGMPSWFVEGLAEYLALGMDPDAEAVVREATIEDALPPLGWSGGYLEYKQGQAAVAWLVARRGPHVIRALLADVARGRSFGKAFAAAAGLGPGPFEERWREHLRRRYWPEIARRQRPETVARRLVDQWNPEAYRTQPVMSPQGDRVACFADHGPFTDVEILSIAHARVQRRMARVPRAFLFERVPATRRGIAWSPDGKRLAIAGAERGPIVTIVSDHGNVVRRLTLPCASVAYPAWAPGGDSLVVAGVRGDRSDLWLVDIRTGRLTRLTNDAWDEREPDWTPDGSALAFASDRGMPLELAPRRTAAGFGGFGLYRLDLASRAVTPLVEGRGNERSPAWSPDGRRLAFVSDQDGTPNLWLIEVGDTARVRLTRLLGGAQALSWSRQDDRLVFSAYDYFGFDLFAVREPLSVPGALDRLRSAAAKLDSLPVDSLAADSLAARTARAGPDSSAADTASARGGPFALSAAALAQHPRGPHGPLAPEEAGLALYDAPDLGFVVGGQLGLRNLFGNRSLYLAADVFVKKPEDSQGMAFYRRLIRRFDLGAGAFRYVNGFAPAPGTFGEQMTGLRLTPQRTYGAFAGAGFAFGKSLRLETNLLQMEVAPARGSGNTRPATSPAVSLIGDNTVAGALGPVTGRRFNLTFAAAVPAQTNGLEYQTLTVDARRYADWTRGYSFAGRLLGAASEGTDAQRFEAGGFATLRGHDDWSLTGTRAVIGNAEIRFPFLQRLGILGPIAVGAPLNTRGVLFVDAGSVWDTGAAPRVLHEAGGHPALDQVAFGFGTGFRAALPFTIFKADVAWSTDFNAISRPRWYVSLGPDF